MSSGMCKFQVDVGCMAATGLTSSMMGTTLS